MRARAFGKVDTPANRLLLRQYHLPKDARPYLEHTNGSALFVNETLRMGRMVYCVTEFWGTSSKPAAYIGYRTEAERDKRIQGFKESVERHVARKAERAAEKARWQNPLKVGDVLYASWGYDQTNVDFYVVTYVSGKRVKVRPIAGERTDEGNHVRAKRPVFYTGEETTHVAQPAGERGVSITIDSSRTAWLDTPGATHYETPSGWGH